MYEAGRPFNSGLRSCIPEVTQRSKLPAEICTDVCEPNTSIIIMHDTLFDSCQTISQAE